MAHAYLIAQLDTSVPFPVVINVGIYSERHLSKGPGQTHLTDALLWEGKGGTYGDARDQLLMAVMGPAPVLNWTHPWLEAIGHHDAQKLASLRNRAKLAVQLQRDHSNFG